MRSPLLRRLGTLILPLSLLLASCSSSHPSQFTQKEALQLGHRIWKNECAGTVSGLVSWNDGESFPSLGIGHFIWFPRGVKPPFNQSWPSFVSFCEKVGKDVPDFFKGPAPWPNKRAFLADKSGLADKMRHWLANNLTLQSGYLIVRSRRSLPAMMQASQNPQKIKKHFEALAATAQGNYCLIDYVNFKGEGLKPSEGYQGQGWGLLQVLEEMRGNPQGRDATREFARAAAVVLQRRIALSPPSRGERRWLEGWMNRCKTYR